MIEVAFYVAIGAAVIGLGWWAISLVVHSSGRMAALGLTELQAATRLAESMSGLVG